MQDRHSQEATSLLFWVSLSHTKKYAYHIMIIKSTPKDERRRQWQPTPVLLPGNSCGQSNLVGYSPWGREESDTTELLHFHFSLSSTEEGNGNPLQYSCLENPRDGSVVGCHLWGRTVRYEWCDLAAAAKMKVYYNWLCSQNWIYLWVLNRLIKNKFT